jgi:hypothetical protein
MFKETGIKMLISLFVPKSMFEAEEKMQRIWKRMRYVTHRLKTIQINR